MDARKLATLEALLGEIFRDSTSSVVNPAAATTLNTAFDEFATHVRAQLLRQTHEKALYDDIALSWNATTETFAIDVTGVVSQLRADYAADPSRIASDVFHMTRRWRDGERWGRASQMRNAVAHTLHTCSNLNATNADQWEQAA